MPVAGAVFEMRCFRQKKKLRASKGPNAQQNDDTRMIIQHAQTKILQPSQDDAQREP